MTTKAKGGKLTAKQQAFVREYLIDLNATQAAIRAGYSALESPVGYYVYFLIDPRDSGIFYVGKGSGRRVKTHVAGVKRGRYDNPKKGRRISEILAAGMSVEEWVFADGLTERNAFSLERKMIATFGRATLTNLVPGVMTEEEAASEKAKAMLALTKPYDVWMAGLSCEKEALVKRVFGGTEKFHSWYCGQLQKLASGSGSLTIKPALNKNQVIQNGG